MKLLAGDIVKGNGVGDIELAFLGKAGLHADDQNEQESERNATSNRIHIFIWGLKTILPPGTSESFNFRVFVAEDRGLNADI